MTTKTFKVPNISCSHCIHTIQTEVGELKGVTDVQASEETKEVRVSWDEDSQSWATIKSLLEEINYPPA